MGPSAGTPVGGGNTSASKVAHGTSTSATIVKDADLSHGDDQNSVQISVADVGFQERQAERARLIALDEEEREQTRLADERRQRAGKHRAWGQPPPTPEGYW